MSDSLKKQTKTVRASQNKSAHMHHFYFEILKLELGDGRIVESENIWNWLGPTKIKSNFWLHRLPTNETVCLKRRAGEISLSDSPQTVSLGILNEKMYR